MPTKRTPKTPAKPSDDLTSLLLKGARAQEAEENDNEENDAGDVAPDEMQTEDDKILDLQRMYGDNPENTLKIFAVGNHGTDLELIDEIAIANFSPKMLAFPPYSSGEPPYNKGKFRLHGRSPTGFLFNREIRVRAAPLQFPALQAINPQAPANEPMAGLMRDLAQQNRALLERIIANEQKPAPDQSAMMAQFLNMMRLAKEMFTPAAVPVSSPGIDAGETLLKQVELLNRIKALSGPADGEGGQMNTMLTLGMPLLTKMIEKSMEPGQQPAPQNQAIAPAANIPGATMGPEMAIEQLPAPNDENRMMQHALNFAIQGAERNADPYAYATIALDSAPEEAIAEIINNPNWFEMLAGIDPRIRAHQVWFSELREEITSLLTEEKEGNITAESATETPAENANTPSPEKQTGTN